VGVVGADAQYVIFYVCWGGTLYVDL